MQYAKIFTDALQFVWGAGFLSPGGPQEVAAMLAGQSLTGCRVLDIGAGLGGVDLLLAQCHGAAEVVGVDVEPQLVAAAADLARAAGLADTVQFQLVAPGRLPFADASFDVVFSKDAMVHIADKPALYRDVLRLLKPGGRFLAADWLWAEGAADSAAVCRFVAGGPLRFVYTTTSESEAALRQSGFADVKISDRRALLQASNRTEIAFLSGPDSQRLAEVVGPEMARARLASAHGRQGVLDSGDLIPSHIFARRPG